MTRLQELLIKKITATRNEKLLQEVNRLLETGFEDEEIYKLNDAQISAVEESKEQIRNGKFLTNDEANKQAKEWLKNR